MSFFGKLWTRIRGIFINAGDDVVSSSPEAIRATYATAIDESKKRYLEMEKAVALLAREREKTEQLLKDLEKEETEIKSRLEGALAAAESDPANPVHREAGARYLTRIQEIDEKQAALSQELEAQKLKVEDYKARLRSFSDDIDKLKREQGEMVAEFVSTQQIIQLESRLRGLAESSVDDSLVTIRDKVGAMKAQAKIATEMRQSGKQQLDDQYHRIGAEKQAQAKFDELLKNRSKQTPTPEKARDLG
ncbi:MAG: PspA/IM30 family protein [Desulfomonilaceae bacterium]